MKFLEEKIIGLKVEEICEFKNSVSFKFDDGSTLSIINAFSWSSLEHGKLVGNKVDRLDYDSDKLSISFSNGEIIKIGLREEDYINGPEAFIFTVSGGPIIVQRLGDD